MKKLLSKILLIILFIAFAFVAIFKLDICKKSSDEELPQAIIQAYSMATTRANNILKPGDYTWKDSYSSFNGSYSSKFNFISNNTNYFGIELSYNMGGVIQELKYLDEYGRTVNVALNNNGSYTWYDENKKTFTIEEDTTVDDEYIYNFIIENTTFVEDILPVELPAGIYVFKDNFVINPYNIQLTFNFISNGLKYTGMQTPTKIQIPNPVYWLRYLSSDDTQTEVYNSQTGWIDENYKTITVLNNQSVMPDELEFIQTNTNYFKDDEEKNAYDLGFQDGFQSGTANGAEIAQYGIFQNAKIDAEFTYYNGEKLTVTDLTPQYIANGVYFQAIAKQYELYENNPDNTLETAKITIKFINPFMYSNDMPLVHSGDTDVQSFILTQVSGIKTSGQFLYKGISETTPFISGQSYIDNDYGMSPVESIQIFYGRAIDTLNSAQLIQTDGNYYGGYSTGFNEGKEAGKEEGYEYGFDEGKEVGKEEGKKEGYENGFKKGFNDGELQGYANAVEEGVSQLGIFNGAVAFIKIFFQLTSDFLGTKIVGDISFGLIVIGLPAVFMIARLVLGFIKKFLGSRGDDQ